MATSFFDDQLLKGRNTGSTGELLVQCACEDVLHWEEKQFALQSDEVVIDSKILLIHKVLEHSLDDEYIS